MKGQKKPSAFSVLMGYAGRHKVLTYLSIILSAACGVLALMPFFCLWRIIKEVVEVAPTFSLATGITHNGWITSVFRCHPRRALCWTCRPNASYAATGSRVSQVTRSQSA